jgi:D-arabinonate dehydratase
MMGIRSVESAVVAVPLREPTAFARAVVTAREYVVVAVEDSDGAVGVGFAVGGRVPGDGAVIRAAVEHCASLVIGDDIAPARLWTKLYDAAILLGRRGAVIRAISAIDIACWDLLGRRAGLSLCRMLGGNRREVPCYASGGYYREGKGLEGLAAELGRYADNGFTSFKIKVGRLDPRDDAERVRVARETVGPTAQLALDANNAWRDAGSAIAALRRFEPYDPWWIEEPVSPDALAAGRAIAAALDTPVATGEIEATRWGFKALLDADAADLVQPDATVAGGITEWLRIANLASAYDRQVAPHWMANLHVQLVAAVDNGLTVEYFDPREDVFNFERLVAEPLEVRAGTLLRPDRPGHGVVFDERAIERWTVGGGLPSLRGAA